VTLEALLTLTVVIGVIVALIRGRFPPSVTVLGGVVVLLATGVIDSASAFAGFSNPAPLTVAALFVLARAVQITGAADRILAAAFPRRSADGSNERMSLARIIAPSAAASAFLNNTPIVAIVAPRVLVWSRQTGRSASRFLMPLSFASLLGGLITLIGTSTNLVVSGLLVEAGMAPIGLFEPARLGIPVAVVGVLFLVVASPRLLPTRRAPSETFDQEGARRFTIEMVVTPGGPLAGKTVTDAGLRALQGVYLVELERQGYALGPVGPDERLEGDDHLVFAGNVDRVVDLQGIAGLQPAEIRHFSAVGDGPDRRLFEAVVGDGSALVGHTLQEVEFRTRFEAAVLAIHRSGERLTDKLGDIRLRPGDVLLVLARRGFRARWNGHRDFVAVARLSGDPILRSERAWVVQVLVAAVLLLAGTGLVDILVAALVAAIVIVAVGVLSVDEARSAVDLDVIVLIAASFGLGAAMQDSGLAETLAVAVSGVLAPLGDRGLIAGLVLATMLLTAAISNNAAAVLMFPLAIGAAQSLGLDARPFAIAVMLGASTDFLTPIGYQTNTMVYGMGGYRFTDFARLGFPLTVLTLAISTVVIPWAWPLR
jgi:di/tricarboxylate transporter